MKFLYVGAGLEPPAQTEVFGYTFALNGDAVDVPDGSLVEQKLLGNASFVVVKSSLVPLALDAESRAVLIAALEEAGVKVDKRWGEARLRKEHEELGLGEVAG